MASLLPSTPFVVQKEKDAKHKEVRGPVCGRAWGLDHDRLWWGLWLKDEGDGSFLAVVRCALYVVPGKCVLTVGACVDCTCRHWMRFGPKWRHRLRPLPRLVRMLQL